jgi:hypothetical protein
MVPKGGTNLPGIVELFFMVIGDAFLEEFFIHGV